MIVSLRISYRVMIATGSITDTSAVIITGMLSLFSMLLDQTIDMHKNSPGMNKTIVIYHILCDLSLNF